MKAPVVVKQYPKSLNGYLNRKSAEFWLFRKGYFVYSEEEISQFSGGKALGLGLIFLPLALLGGRKCTKVTYQLR
jgi:hypothetical protein